MQLKKFLTKLEKQYDVALQEPWDNCGLLVGRKEKPLTTVLLALDVTTEVIEFAIKNRVDLIVSHHPIIFKPIKAVTTETVLGRKLIQLIQNDIAVYSMHTNLDKNLQGLNTYLAKKIGAIEMKPLNLEEKPLYEVSFSFKKEEQAQLVAQLEKQQKNKGLYQYELSETHCLFWVRKENLKNSINMIQCTLDRDINCSMYLTAKMETRGGLGTLFTLDSAVSIEAYAHDVKKALQLKNVRIVSSDISKQIKKIAVVSGSGSSFIGEKTHHQCDLFVTGDIDYHTAQDAKDSGISLMDIGHFEGEIIFAEFMKERIATFFSGNILVFHGEEPFSTY